MNLLYPMFAMVLLTMTTMMIMGRTRIRAVRTGEVKLGYFKTRHAEGSLIAVLAWVFVAAGFRFS